MLETKEGSVGAKELAKRGGLAVVLSVVANIVVLQAVVIPELVEVFSPLNVPPVALFSALGALGATVAYAVTDRLSESPDRTFTKVAAVALVLSFVPDIGLLYVDPAATVPAVVVLMVMHVVVAVACVASLTGRLV
jgi:ABC-type glucose/galactose transport system permease subunit